jgi:Zn-finger nucleic acid-binding protein
VSPSASRCEHCDTELLLKACPRCLSRVFAGYQHCPECGAELERAADGEVRSDLPCPRCSQPLRARMVGDIVIDECGGCRGLFLDQIAIRRVITDRAQARAEALLGALPKAETHVNVRPGEKMYLKCPSCQALMNRRQFATGAGIVVDVCRKHGTFFDVGELPAIIDFVMQGGLEKAAKKDLEQERERLARERERLAAASHDALRLEIQRDMSRGSAVVDLLTSLFG